jgi:hypothetical protein
MQPEYEFVMELSGLVWTMIPMLLHALTLVLQCLLGAYLLVHGAALALRPDVKSELLLRLGALRGDSLAPRTLGVLLLVAGLLVLAPVISGAPWWTATLGCIAAFAAWWTARLSAVQAGRVMRGTAAFAAVVTVLFGVWERNDPAALSARILFKAQDWRMHELEWQLANDERSPKVGDIAPDFELQDPSGERTVRLSNYFGKRPVALVFGSYT